MEENAKFLVDLFVAALNTNEYKACCVGKKVVIVTNNAPAHSQMETLAREQLVMVSSTATSL
ncbi:hypothetical protein PC129_g22006 [Phytophthora cactorum]|uniref:Tc1-like transposase DDE domain-containing protein n=1 Tax=Phytophthora cactorum TaxID=29920 RepID=A0A329RD10_9STRA|nr:hypothetical protein Pcac1_g2206 [Phytophthora cactorum]KAG2794650.1 hypothetical protein PC111_g22502 [Phytophthora cactorum]KAG2797708.1 hypothetical protein PC112_g21668 [Phytophthora cactorum]KAG2819827.1 hypothetical protein PC113_g22682 [Phytophthora cactorum]KAG2874269.1 hypothetical protein PC114_g25365 [Phytophthora cactorum]